jgi:aminoglycoside phosphotransferase (APT) family kinase protein
MTAAAASVSPVRDVRDGGVGLWDFVAESGLESLVAAASKDPNAKVTALLVSPQTGAAEVVVKAPTTAAAERAVEAEARVLAELHARDLGELGATIPRVVGFVDSDGRRAAVMTALSGRPMSTAYAARLHTRRPARVALDFEAAGRWLAELQSRSLAHVEPLDMDGDVRARLRGRFGNDPSLQADLDCLAAVHARLRLNEVPRTVVHGDFWLGNVLLSEGRVSGVVDWEAATTCGEPVRDLVRFANMYALYLDRRTRPGRRVRGHRGLRAGAWGAALEYALYGTGWFPELYRRFLEDGLARLGAARESWRDAALAGIAEVAALTDHDDFGRLHLQLFRRLAAREVEA